MVDPSSAMPSDDWLKRYDIDLDLRQLGVTTECSTGDSPHMYAQVDDNITFEPFSYSSMPTLKSELNVYLEMVYTLRNSSFID